MKELLIFDLDGTLIDSKRDLADSVNAMRVHLGEPLLADETVYSYVGNGAPVLVRRALPGRGEEEIEAYDSVVDQLKASEKPRPTTIVPTDHESH